MDYIEVVDLEIFAYHGVLDHEKKDGQNFYVSFKAYMDLEPSALTDDLSLSVSYADMCATVKSFVQGSVYDLIEKVADGAAKKLLHTYELINRVELWVKKPSAPIGEPVAYPQVYVDRSWHKAYIAIGSNMGDRRKTIDGSIENLNTEEGQVTKLASIIETEPWGPVEQEGYLNTVVEYRTLLSPQRLMTFLLEVEQAYGRERKEHWGPRTLDLDIIFYDDLVTDDPYVILPHPYMHERAFVLEPMMELCPNKVHPLLKQRVKDLHHSLG